MESPWESWIRPLLLIAVALGVGAAWYFELIPDAAVGVPLGAALVAAAAVVVWTQVRAAAPTPLLRRAGAVAIGAAVLVALWSPWTLLGPGGEIASADVSDDAPAIAIPATGDGPARYRVYFHAAPAFGSDSASVHLELAGRPGTPPATRLGRLDTQTTKGSGQAAGRAVKRRDLVWPVVADLSAGGRVVAHESEPGTVSWPAHVEVHQAPPPPALPAAAGVVVFLFALAVEATNRRRARSWLSTLAAATPIFTVLFGAWFAPGHLTAAIFGAALVAAIGGAVVSYALLPLFRRRLAPPPPPALEAAEV